MNRIEDKPDEALYFQETALRLIQAQKPSNKQAILDNQLGLTALYLNRNDYRNAESVLKDAVATCKSEPTLFGQERGTVYRAYGKVLRQLHKDAEAQAIEATADYKAPQTVADKPADTKQSNAEKTLISKTDRNRLE